MKKVTLEGVLKYGGKRVGRKGIYIDKSDLSCDEFETQFRRLGKILVYSACRTITKRYNSDFKKGVASGKV